MCIGLVASRRCLGLIFWGAWLVLFGAWLLGLVRGEGHKWLEVLEVFMKRLKIARSNRF